MKPPGSLLLDFATGTESCKSFAVKNYVREAVHSPTPVGAAFAAPARIRGTFDGVAPETKKGSAFRRSLFDLCGQADYAQVITPLVISQVFADCECVAVALHEGGGPATFVTTTVTFCDGVNP